MGGGSSQSERRVGSADWWCSSARIASAATAPPLAYALPFGIELRSCSLALGLVSVMWFMSFAPTAAPIFRQRAPRPILVAWLRHWRDFRLSATALGSPPVRVITERRLSSPRQDRIVAPAGFGNMVVPSHQSVVRVLIWSSTIRAAEPNIKSALMAVSPRFDVSPRATHASASNPATTTILCPGSRRSRADRAATIAVRAGPMSVISGAFLSVVRHNLSGLSSQSADARSSAGLSS